MDGAVKITDITVTKKGRYALFCDGEFQFSLDEETYLKSGVKIGAEMTPGELQALRAASDYAAAKNKALDYLAYRDHTEKELRGKLARKFDPETGAQAVSRMRELGLVDDAAYAEKLAEELIVRRFCSKRAAAAKLYEKGVDRQTVAETLAVYDDDEQPSIRAVVERKYAQKLGDPAKRAAVFAALARLGFRSGDIRAVLGEYAADREAEFPFDPEG
ncbi:MAG: RecX family transcriptional regulator [Oscillospiraceae bacterium]|nr:RecX family transcriptional regulator [Oscillospiraceae bacterium]